MVFGITTRTRLNKQDFWSLFLMFSNINLKNKDCVHTSKRGPFYPGLGKETSKRPKTKAIPDVSSVSGLDASKKT